MAQKKADIRRYINTLKSSHTPEELVEMSASPLMHLEELIALKDPKVILMYHSLPDEVYTHALISRLAAQGRTVLLPSVQSGILVLRRFEEGATNVGEYGITEAMGPEFADYSAIEMAVIPGVAFTQKGVRMGRGKGYYDRLLPAITCLKAGLCFPFQVMDDIPCEEHDIIMDTVIF